MANLAPGWLVKMIPVYGQTGMPGKHLSGMNSESRKEAFVFPHTHWDRAWYWPFERFRTKLCGGFSQSWDYHKFWATAQNQRISDSAGLPELVGHRGDKVLGGSQMLYQGAFGGRQVSAQNRADDPEMLAQPKPALGERVKRADELELDDEVDKSGALLEERVASRLDQESVEAKIDVQDF